MNNEPHYHHKKKHSYGAFGTALLFILAGALLLSFNLGYIPAMYKPIFISWQMLLIAIGAVELCKRHYSGGVILVAIGSIFIYPVLTRIFPEYSLGFDLSIKQWWPLVLIIVGLALILSKKAKNSRCRKYFSGNDYDSCNQSNTSNSNKINENVLFSGTEHIILSQEFEGGEANVVFGEIKIDLRKAQLSKDGANYLEAACLFGSIQIFVPSDWDVRLKKSVMFGNIEDKRFVSLEPTTTNKPIITLKCDCLFGNIEIKN